MERQEGKISVRSFILGILFAVFFAWLTVYFADTHNIYITATQIPVLPYVLLFVMVLALNPLCRLLRVVRFFNRAEVMLIFIMGLVSSGVSTFGLTAQLVPVVGSLFNPAWNHEQSAWNINVVPLLEDKYFLSADGVSEAAREYAENLDRQRELHGIVVAAEARLDWDQRVRMAEEALRRHLEEGGKDEEALLGEARLREHLQRAREGAEQARRQWQQVKEQQPGLPPLEVLLADYRSRLEAAEQQTLSSRERLRELEEASFAKVELFRQGLPREQRAIPGFVIQPDDTRSSYLARFRRTVSGHRAGTELEQARQALLAGNREDAAAALIAARLHLDRMHDTLGMEQDLQEVREREDELTGRLLIYEGEMRELSVAFRQADREDIRRLEARISRTERRADRTRRQRDRVREQRRLLRQEIELAAGVMPLLTIVDELKEAVAAGGLTVDHKIERLDRVAAALPGLDGCWQRFTIGDVPWRQWWAPLWRWGLLVGFTYVVLMTLNVLIFRQWAYHEKLVYPLAQLPQTLAGEQDSDDGSTPSIFQSSFFWVGFAVSGVFLAYNVLAYSEVIPGLTNLELDNWWDDYLDDTAFEGLLGGRFQRNAIFFTMIGLSFLIPAKISFSLWFFSVLSMVQVLIMVWLGHGESEASFPKEWLYTLNFRTAEGAGALVVFSSAVLFKCRHYLFCAFSPAKVQDLPDDERRELRWSSLFFVVASLGVILMVWRSLGASLLYTVVTFLFILIITVGLVRAVAEGGLLGFQAWANPFHLVRSFFGFDKAWTSSSLFAPILIYYGVLFLDIKTFIAPAMANSIKIRDDLRMRRGIFHLAVFSAILVAAVVAVVVSIVFAYANGADVMSGWFYNLFPQQLFDSIGRIQEAPPLSTPAETVWVVIGGLAMTGLLYFRQWLFWLPHPLGMVMLVNPLMGGYWFSILLGWLAKSMVTKYGNKDTYGRARLIFLGLIVGELVMVVLAMVVTLYTGDRIPLDLNRN